MLNIENESSYDKNVYPTENSFQNLDVWYIKKNRQGQMLKLMTNKLDLRETHLGPTRGRCALLSSVSQT